jgi:uncharacterized Zn finger protein (UPF0148 family)
MNSIKITCGRCQSTFEVPPAPIQNVEGKVSCPLCGYSRGEVLESTSKKKKVLKD